MDDLRWMRNIIKRHTFTGQLYTDKEHCVLRTVRSTYNLHLMAIDETDISNALKIVFFGQHGKGTIDNIENYFSSVRINNA